MVCPYCGEEMVLGRIPPIGFRSAFWLPYNVRMEDLGLGFLTVNKIEKFGGRIIGIATNYGLLSASLCKSYLCQKCNLLITQL